ncbi:MAG: hypothetical protein RL642_1064 [Bacteroidota bacterium]|jgi:hypothetical protein
MQPNQLAPLLYRYFSQSGEVAIPSLGQLSLTASATINDFASKELRPVASMVAFQNGDLPINDKQFDYLVKKSGSPKAQVNDALVLLGEELHERLQVEKKLEWMGVGSFVVDEHGAIQFQPKANYVDLYKPLHYKHVIREDAVYEMRVGEEQKSTVEMENFFEEQRNSAGKSKWIKGALILVGILAIALVVRYSKGSFNLLDGRYNKLQFKALQSTYKVI